jgi:hypothetical protein
MRFKRPARLLIMGVAATAGLQGCSSVPATHVLVPARETVPAMQNLSQQAGAVASVITVSGDEAVFTVAPGGPDTLAGKRLESGSYGQDVAYPFDLLALIYYTDRASDKLPQPYKIPVRDRYPEPKGVGAAEEALSCSALDEELARAEALRWVPRSNGAMPYTSAEKLKLHVKHAAIDVGVALLVLAGGVGGSGGGAQEYKAGEWAVSEEGFRWAVSAIDERMAGLLTIKEHKSCAGRSSLQADTSDVQLWRSLEVGDQPPPAGPPDERAALTKRTAVFDLLGPKAVVQKLAFELPAGESAEQVVSNVNWFQGFNSLANFSSAMKGAQQYLEGTVVLTDRSLEMQVKKQVGAPRSSVAPDVISIAYQDIASTQVQRMRRDCVVVVTQNDGHVDSFRAVRGFHIDCEQVDAVRKTLQEKVDAARAAAQREH